MIPMIVIPIIMSQDANEFLTVELKPIKDI